MFRISYVGLLLVCTVGSRPFKLPEATKIVPSGMVCADAYHLALDSLLPGSLQAWPLRLPSVEERERYLIAVKPSPTVGSIKVKGAFPPRESQRPSGRKAPPEQKAFVCSQISFCRNENLEYYDIPYTEALPQCLLLDRIRQNMRSSHHRV